MAGIIISTTGAATNPTTNFLPVNDGGIFADSPVRVEDDTNSVLLTTFAGTNFGFSIDGPNESLNIGRHDDPAAVGLRVSGGDTLEVGINKALNPGSAIAVNGGSITIDSDELNIGVGLTSGTAGASSGTFLVIQIAGTPYKINLLNA